MSSDLLVAFALRGAFGEVKAFKDAVFAEPLAETDHGLLATPFPGKFLLLGLLPAFEFFVIGKKVILQDMLAGRDPAFRDDIVY